MNTQIQITKCVIDCETTGLDAKTNDIIQLALLPVNDQFVPIKAPLNIRIKALTPETACTTALAINKLNPREGMDITESRDAFYSWRTLNCIDMIAPLAHNYQFDKLFIEKWLIACGLLYQDYFHYIVRDSMILATAANDARKLKGYKPLSRSVSLGTLCSAFAIDSSGTHDALTDCHLTLEVYKKLLVIS